MNFLTNDEMMLDSPSSSEDLAYVDIANQFLVAQLQELSDASPTQQRFHNNTVVAKSTRGLIDTEKLLENIRFENVLMQLLVRVNEKEKKKVASDVIFLNHHQQQQQQRGTSQRGTSFLPEKLLPTTDDSTSVGDILERSDLSVIHEFMNSTAASFQTRKEVVDIKEQAVDEEKPEPYWCTLITKGNVTTEEEDEHDQEESGGIAIFAPLHQDDIGQLEDIDASEVIMEDYFHPEHHARTMPPSAMDDWVDCAEWMKRNIEDNSDYSDYFSE
jgi:hypothetical protein